MKERVTLGKKYRRKGDKALARVVFVDNEGLFPVVAEVDNEICRFRAHGETGIWPSEFDLEEVPE